MTHSIESLTRGNIRQLAFELEYCFSGRTSTDVLRGISLDVIDRLSLPLDRERVFEDNGAQIAFCSLLGEYGLRDEIIRIDAARQAIVVPISELRPNHYWIQRHL